MQVEINKEIKSELVEHNQSISSIEENLEIKLENDEICSYICGKHPVFEDNF